MKVSGEIHFNLEEYNSLDVQTFGGEYESDDLKFSNYGIQIGNLSFQVTPEVAVELCKKLKEHLELNGRKI